MKQINYNSFMATKPTELRSVGIEEPEQNYRILEDPVYGEDGALYIEFEKFKKVFKCDFTREPDDLTGPGADNLVYYDVGKDDCLSVNEWNNKENK